MSDLQDKAEYVERILAGTKFERYFYVCVCGTSAVFLLICASVIVMRNHGDLATILPLFGSTGVISYSTGQIMKVWSDAMKFVTPLEKDGKK